MAKQMTSIAKSAKGLGDYAGTAVNTSIVLVTTGLEQLTTLATYRCPCVDPTQISGCNHTIAQNVCNNQLLNYGYGLSFVIAPAIALFIFGLVSNPRMWKSLTGVCKKTEELKRGFVECSWTFVGIGGQALIAPITWVTIALLDGRYYACAITALPYDTVGAGTTPTYANCEKVAQAKVPITSNLYKSNRSYSQILGWVVLAAAIVLGMIVYAYTQCNSPLTYYHAKYFQLYRAAEQAEFDDEMKKKAQKDAEANVLKFMDKRRTKLEWDQISTVYEFHRDKKNLALYSHLHEWVLNQQKKSQRAKGEKEPLIDKEKEEAEGGDVNNITVVANVINT